MSAKPSSGPDAWEEDWESQADVCAPLPLHAAVRLSQSPG